METIQDLEGYVQKRKAKGKSAVEVRTDLVNHGYDLHAAAAITMRYWHARDED